MAKRPTIYESITGYSRYDLPQNIAFTATAGLLYPARVQFCNAADKVTLGAELFLRANAMTVPTFNPFSVRLHRFWVPMRLYHPDMRVNVSGFDMTSSTQNYITNGISIGTSTIGGLPANLPFYMTYIEPRSLLSMLRLASGRTSQVPYQALKTLSRGSNTTVYNLADVAPNEQAIGMAAGRTPYFNADSYLAYWDIVRQFYSFSQWGTFSVAWPLAYIPTPIHPTPETLGPGFDYYPADKSSRWTQTFGALSDLDDYYENAFFPRSIIPTSTSFTGYNRASLFAVLAFATDPQRSRLLSNDTWNTWEKAWSTMSVTGPYPESSVQSALPASDVLVDPAGDEVSVTRFTLDNFYYTHHPLAVVPSSPDRLSRLLPIDSAQDSVSISNLKTVPQLAYASRLQEYRDLLSAGNNRFDRWLTAFFGTRLDFEDTPKLLFSQSLGMGSRPMFNMAGNPGDGLGQFGGELSVQGRIKTESYFFREPGYLIDMISIRPFYYWSCIQADYARYLTGSDYFLPKFNDLGYQLFPTTAYDSAYLTLSSSDTSAPMSREPIYNEFRGTYDEALGGYSLISGVHWPEQPDKVYASWVMQRYSEPLSDSAGQFVRAVTGLFCDIANINSPFASNTEDNFHVALMYDVDLRSRVAKTFTTRLNTR